MYGNYSTEMTDTEMYCLVSIVKCEMDTHMTETHVISHYIVT